MARFVWDSKMSVSVQKFDDSHKKLVDMVNELDDAMRAGKGKDVMEKILGGLVSYTATHFGDEEKLMLGHKYAGYIAHKAEHDALVKKVVQFQGDFHNGKIAMSVEVMQFLKDWLVNHIMGTDKKYGPFLNNLGVK